MIKHGFYHVNLCKLQYCFYNIQKEGNWVNVERFIYYYIDIIYTEKKVRIDRDNVLNERKDKMQKKYGKRDWAMVWRKTKLTNWEWNGRKAEWYIK